MDFDKDMATIAATLAKKAYEGEVVEYITILRLQGENGEVMGDWVVELRRPTEADRARFAPPAG